eukprot:scaffold358_cov256-Pinguiococcus_pyrenoidosus.AAC.18
MPSLSAHVAMLVFAERAVDQRQLSQLALLVLVEVIVDGHHELGDHSRGVLHGLLVRARDEHVELVVDVVAVDGAVPMPTAFLHTALPADGDAAARLALHALLRVAARADDEADEVVVGELLHGNVHLPRDPLAGAAGHAVAEVGVQPRQLLDDALALLRELLAHSLLSRVGPLAVRVVQRLRRRAPLGVLRRQSVDPRRLCSHVHQAIRQLLKPHLQKHHFLHLLRAQLTGRGVLGAPAAPAPASAARGLAGRAPATLPRALAARVGLCGRCRLGFVAVGAIFRSGGGGFVAPAVALLALRHRIGRRPQIQRDGDRLGAHLGGGHGERPVWREKRARSEAFLHLREASRPSLSN